VHARSFDVHNKKRTGGEFRPSIGSTSRPCFCVFLSVFVVGASAKSQLTGLVAGTVGAVAVEGAAGGAEASPVAGTVVGTVP
jgi:hypothetical protein